MIMATDEDYGGGDGDENPHCGLDSLVSSKAVRAEVDSTLWNFNS